MGKRGPPPKPTNLKVLEGNPGKRPLNGDEPQPEHGAECPTWLSAAAKAQWRYHAPLLEACGILTKADTLTLAAFCDAVANYQRATKEIELQESLVDGGKISPMVTAQKNYADLMIKFGGRLGLSPSDRNSIKVPPKKAKSKWADKIPSNG